MIQRWARKTRGTQHGYKATATRRGEQVPLWSPYPALTTLNFLNIYAGLAFRELCPVNTKESVYNTSLQPFTRALARKQMMGTGDETLRYSYITICQWTAGAAPLRWLLFVVALGMTTAHAQNDEYTLNAGDSIRIYVYGEPDLTFESLLIGQNGRISYPFLGGLTVEGKTVNDLQETLISGLKPDYLIDPRISVSIINYRPFFVNGEVKSPGGLPFQPGLTLRKAISLAGGFTERANKKEVLVIADSDPDLEERKMGLDYRVKPGDIITVQDTFF